MSLQKNIHTDYFKYNISSVHFWNLLEKNPIFSEGLLKFNTLDDLFKFNSNTTGDGTTNIDPITENIGWDISTQNELIKFDITTN